MTRIGIISDVHADVHALRDALAQIERLACADRKGARVLGAHSKERLMPRPYMAVPADTRRFSWRSPRGDVGFFQPNGRLTIVGKTDELASNRGDWTAKRSVYAARIFVGFSVGKKPRRKISDVVRIAKRIRKGQVGLLDTPFVYQRGLYTTTKRNDPLVDEKGAQIIIFSSAGADRRAFRQQMIAIAEEIATMLRQEEVVIEIQKGGIFNETIGVTPVRRVSR